MNKSIIITSAFAVLLSVSLCGCGSEADAADAYGMPTAISQQKNETVTSETEPTNSVSTEYESISYTNDTETQPQITETEGTEIFFTETVTGFFDDTETGEVTEITPAPYVLPESTSSETAESQTLPAQTTTSTTTATVQTTTTTAAATTQTTTEAATAAQTTAAASNPAASMTLSYGGASLKIGDSAQNFVNSTSPSFTESAPSCYGNGENINYYYDDFTIYVWNENENYMTYGIDIFGTGVPTSEGIAVGSDVDELISVYGEDYAVQDPDSNSWILKQKDCPMYQ